MKSTRFLLDQLKVTFRQSIVSFRRAVVPVKGIDMYFRYFSTCTKLTVEKDATAVFQFNLYLLLLAYTSLLYLAFYLLPISPVVRLVLADALFIQQTGGQYYLLFLGIIGYTADIHWAVYRGCHRKLNAMIKRALSGSTAVLVQYRWRTVVITNGLQFFILYLDLSLIVFMAVFVFKLTSTITSSDSILLLMALSPVTLFHLLLYVLLWISFGHTLCFMATFGFTAQLYAFTFFRQNHVKLRQTLKMVTRSQYTRLKSALRQNLRLFEEFFFCNAFFGPILTVYLAIHLPSSAYFFMVIAFGQVDGLMRFILIGLVAETVLGSLVVHLICAHFSSFVHKSGKVLLSLNAKSIVSKSKPSLKVKHNLYCHIQRLVVRKKYGITYFGK